MKFRKKSIITSCLLSFSILLFSQKKESKNEKPIEKSSIADAATFSALRFRSVGPAVTSGRVGDIAVCTTNKSTYYVAAASSGVWKTVNNGITFEPVFDGQSSYSIGCIAIDPTNDNVLWVGTGENNNQRSVAYGDGIYKSEDGGKTWKNMGLKNSEHIGRIVVDPTNSNTVYVAAYGPLWSSGGERGIYKTIDGGKTWKQILFVSENTGFNEIWMDPRYSTVLYATAHQRRRHEWTYISGGPESALYKSTDAGQTWDKVTNGLPSGDVGRIGMCISPANPDIVYAILESDSDQKGFYKSSDRGASWSKQNSWSTAGNYYQEIVPDPKDPNKVYSLDTWCMVTTDGGKNFKPLGEKNKHVDNHALYIDPQNTEHLIMGCDGGLYESYDGAKTWDFKSNLPITQFYRVAVDQAKPFYNIYGGTQDNNSMGGPSRTLSASGITNADWFITVGGDGFESQIDPTDPNIVYSQWQYGGLIRFDRKSGEVLDIKPQEKEGEPAYRWNWDAPLLISKFSNQRLYFAANKIFRSDDRGNSWKVISPDLSRQLDRNKLPVMGKVWGMDAVAKNQSTSIYGNITAFSESPKNENILFAGTDDGLIQITGDGGKSWTKIEKFAGIPDRVLVQNILASQHDEKTVFAVFNNHRNGDFKPYVMKSSDGGKSWVSISSNLPERGSVYCIAEDHKNSNLLFAGTEFGLFFTIDGGKNWLSLKGGLPPTSVRDIAIQTRENDLVIATFGRGFYVLDDFSPLQNVKKEDLEKVAHLFPIKNGYVYVQSVPYGHKGKSFQGASFFNTENPPVGATFTYYVKDNYPTTKEKRKEQEKEKIKNNQPVHYPSADSIRLEDREESAYILFSILDLESNCIRKYKQPASKGMNRFTWDGRYAKTSPISFYSPNPDNPYESEDAGPLAIPGEYFVSAELMKDGNSTQLIEKTKFAIQSPVEPTIPVDKVKLAKFSNELSNLRNTVLASESYRSEMVNRLKYVKEAVLQSQKIGTSLLKDINNLENKLAQIDLAFNGDGSLARREFETLPGINGIIEGIVGGLWSVTAQPTETYAEAMTKAKNKFKVVYASLKEAKKDLETIETKLDAAGAPYTPGRFPEYKE